MGKIDTITKEYMENSVVFADAFNQFLYHGDQKIDSALLTELDTTFRSRMAFTISSSCPIKSVRRPDPISRP